PGPRLIQFTGGLKDRMEKPLGRVQDQPVSDAARLKVQESYGKLPLSFEANQGQTDSRVQFLSRGHGYSLFLTPTESVLTLRGPAEAGSAGSQTVPRAVKTAAPSSNRSAVLRMKLLGANPAPQATGLEELPGKSNYFLGNDPKQWRTNVPNYGKVRFAGVYPGVDLVYYGNQRQLEYDFVVAPGADPSAIRLGFAGAERLEIDPQGELALETPAGEVRWHKPVVYQEVGGVRQMVDGHYVRKGEETVGFEIASYDPRHPLIIDPVLIYSTYLGGSAFDAGVGIAVDSSGSAYVTGETDSTNFPTTAGAFQAGCGVSIFGCIDAFVTKLNAAGNALVYSTYLGGSENDVGHAIAVDAGGNAYITGLSNSPNFPVAKAFQSAFKGGEGNDVIVVKVNAAGNALAYSTYLGGSKNEESRGIAVDAAGNATITG
ncbi:MAG: SBBP repeat-containing protein, partial [Terriglobia bacterium]